MGDKNTERMLTLHTALAGVQTEHTNILSQDHKSKTSDSMTKQRWKGRLSDTKEQNGATVKTLELEVQLSGRIL